MIEKFEISRDDQIYEMTPDVTKTDSGKLVCLFNECTHHGDRRYTRIMQVDSTDRGRTWSDKEPFTDSLYRKSSDSTEPSWNCPRIVTLSDGRLVACVDRVSGEFEGSLEEGSQEVFLWVSEDEGESWNGPRKTPVEGIVPDQLVELQNGEHADRWLLSAHTVQVNEEGEDYGNLSEPGPNTLWKQRVWYSDDEGQRWHGPIDIAAEEGLALCEGSIMELPAGELVCFLRENSGRGLDCFKAISEDGGESWEGVYEMPLPGCHRPVAGLLNDGKVMITHRFMQGGSGWVGWWTQNTFAALTDVESCLARKRDGAHTRIKPLDYDRSPKADCGYTGWVQFDDGEIYVVNYIVDDARATPVREPADYEGDYEEVPRAQIRGYSLHEDDFLVTT